MKELTTLRIELEVLSISYDNSISYVANLLCLGDEIVIDELLG